jgi:hypothetical protein
MKTAQQFYEMHHLIDLGICTKDECIKMMNGYSNYLLGLSNTLANSHPICQVKPDN